MALRRITQETFDAAVKENIEEFDMDPEDALRDAVQQFESQGVDLTCIVKAVPTSSSDVVEDVKTHQVLKALESLRVNKDSNDVSKLSPDLKSFTEQCQLGFAQRYLAAQKDAYPVIIAVCKKSVDEPEALSTAVSALAALTDGQPDLLVADGQQFLVDTLKKYQADPALARVLICAVRHCSLKHEMNRVGLVKAGVLPLLTGVITQNRGCAPLVKEASAALRVMTFDDDVRVPYGQAHENAKDIVLLHNGLKVLIQAAEAHVGNTSVLSDLCATISRLAVRNEFCQDICNLGGLKFMMSLLADNFESADLVRQVLSAIRAIAGNDDVKDMVVNAGGVPLIVIAMNKHNTDAAVCEQGCACLSVLALRKPKNCAVIMADGGALAAVQAMKTHPKSVNVQKQSCMLLRNLVARMGNFTQAILDMGAEALITQALRDHQDCGDVGKAALRDLGCQVELRELWTGKHGGLSN